MRNSPSAPIAGRSHGADCGRRLKRGRGGGGGGGKDGVVSGGGALEEDEEKYEDGGAELAERGALDEFDDDDDVEANGVGATRGNSGERGTRGEFEDDDELEAEHDVSGWCCWQPIVMSNSAAATAPCATRSS